MACQNVAPDLGTAVVEELLGLLSFETRFGRTGASLGLAYVVENSDQVGLQTVLAKTFSLYNQSIAAESSDWFVRDGACLGLRALAPQLSPRELPLVLTFLV